LQLAKGNRVKITSIAIAIGLGVALPQAALAENLVVKLDGLRSSKGNVIICVWNQPAAFPDCENGKPVARQTMTAAAAIKDAMTFRNITAGTIAISVFHDENGNNRFDTNFVRMPLEGVGMSNNPKMGFGPPKYRNSTFVPKPGAIVRIKMTYL